jgi:hypothetical protein
MFSADLISSEPGYPVRNGPGLSIGVHLNLVDALESPSDQTSRSNRARERLVILTDPNDADPFSAPSL